MRKIVDIEKDEEKKKKKDRDSLYREFNCNYWNDTSVVDEFSNIDKHLYPYLLTNTHSNLIECYPLSIKTISFETDYSVDEIEQSLKHLEELNFIRYDKKTKEILLLKYVYGNWSISEKYLKGITKQLNKITSNVLIDEIEKNLKTTRFSLIRNHNNTISIGYINDIEEIYELSSNDNDTRKENESTSEDEHIEDRTSEDRILKKSIKDLSTKELSTFANYIEMGNYLNQIVKLYDNIKQNPYQNGYVSDKTEEGIYIENLNDFKKYIRSRDDYNNMSYE